jgi:hypothetical protein
MDALSMSYIINTKIIHASPIAHKQYDEFTDTMNENFFGE